MSEVGPIPALIATETLQYLLDKRSRLGLLDVRDEGEFNGSHIPSAVCVPRRILEYRIGQMFPFRGEQLIVCDDNGLRAQRAAQTLRRLGYTRTATLWGGVNRWFSEGRPTEWGINVPSKDFGESVEVLENIPTLTATELAHRLARGNSLRIFDTRTPEEFRRFSIPGAECIPNVEIALRAWDIRRDDPQATIVINCGGRTRSIIGASTLRRMGIDGVVSLKNGTSGWALAGYEVERGNRRVRLEPPSAQSRAFAERHAARIAREDGVRLIGCSTLRKLQSQAQRSTVYFIDVRTREEYLQGHIPGFTWFPGGQAIQRSDDAVPIRGVPVVFSCDRVARAAITASWFRRMGFDNVLALNGGVEAWRAGGNPLEHDDPFDPPIGVDDAQSSIVSAQQLHDAFSGPHAPRVFFVGTSREFADGHVPGSSWLSRSWLDIRIADLCPDRRASVVLTDRDGKIASLAVGDLKREGYDNCSMLERGLDGWTAAGFDVERGLTNVMIAPEDVLPAIPHRSHENMMSYLRWEEALGHKYSHSIARRH